MPGQTLFLCANARFNAITEFCGVAAWLGRPGDGDGFAAAFLLKQLCGPKMHKPGTPGCVILMGR